ncbi:minor capsid protein [Hathewaya histolytica]|uniref:minor capsid protein n=1 Tax=Hathewaya histolytica TaxID=1498 RepID=UPI003B676EE0
MDKNQKYWEKRQEKLIRELYNKQEKKTLKILREYKNTQKELEEIIVKLYMKYEEGGQLSYTEMSKYNRLTTLYNEIDKAIKELGSNESKAIRNDLIENYYSAAERVGETLEKGNIGVKAVEVNKKAVEKAIMYPWSGSDYKSRVWENKEYLAKKVKETITRGMIEGSSISNMTKALKEEMGKGAYECRRLVRTETSHILNSATYDRYKENNVTKVQFWAAEDERTCEECGAEHEKIYNIEDAPMLPLHPNCRCTLIPVIE